MAGSKTLPNVQQIEIADVGIVEIKRSDKARKLSITVQPRKGVRMVIPKHVSLEQAQELLHEKRDWMLKHLERMQEQENKVTVFEPGKPFSTRYHELYLLPHRKEILKAHLERGRLVVEYPVGQDVKQPHIQDFIRKAVEEAYRREAKVHLPKRVAFFAEKFGLSYQNVTIKKAGTRWGSCSSTNNINLNLHLMRLPEHLCDYVILHELAHTVEKNHGPNFWALLDQLCEGKAKALDKELKNYRIAIF